MFQLSSLGITHYKEKSFATTVLQPQRTSCGNYLERNRGIPQGVREFQITLNWAHLDLSFRDAISCATGGVLLRPLAIIGKSCL